jgi:2-dehydro-3-deoxyphosphogluconate aldolase / (4S)-4-hydroxy-2-oxoglutarate aldolase
MITMARFSRLEVLNTIVDTGLVPVFYHADKQIAQDAALACAAGGLRLFEFTNRGDFAPDVFRELSRCLREGAPEMILGVGSIVDAETAAMYVAYGANFVVGPVLNPAVAKFCNRRKIPYMPGCGSASEISSAEELGAEIVKVFPGDCVGGPGFVKSILGPCPWTRIMPTGGVEATRESLAAWFGAGVAAVGIGTHLLKKDWVADRNWPAVTARTAQVLNLIREVRSQGLFLGIDHFALYPYAGASGADIAAWYGKVFGFQVKEYPASFFLEGPGPGRLEVAKEGPTDRCHIAVRVANFDAALSALQQQGFEFEAPVVSAETRSAFLKQTDPAGNRVNLLWRR